MKHLDHNPGTYNDSSQLLTSYHMHDGEKGTIYEKAMQDFVKDFNGQARCLFVAWTLNMFRVVDSDAASWNPFLNPPRSRHPHARDVNGNRMTPYE